MSYRGDWIVNLTLMGLIVLGGIGFIVHLVRTVEIRRLRFELGSARVHAQKGRRNAQSLAIPANVQRTDRALRARKQSRDAAIRKAHPLGATQ